MTTNKMERLRFIALPLFWVAVGFNIAYALFDYLLIQSGILALDDDVVGYWMPAGLSLVPILIWVSPRLKLLYYKSSRSRESMVALAVVIAAVPAMIAHSYISSASGALTMVPSAAVIANAPHSRYYATSDVCIDKEQAAVFNDFEERGRRGDRIDMGIYVVAPVCASADPVWIGHVYHESFDTDGFEVPAQAYFTKILTQYGQESTNGITYLERPLLSRDLRGLRHALESSNAVKDVEAALILLPHGDDFATRTGHTLIWSVGVLCVGLVLFAALILVPPVFEAEFDALRGGQKAARFSLASSDLRVFVPRTGEYGLPLLIDTNILVFVAMVLSGLGVISFATDDLMRWGANYPPALHGMGILRIFSSQFVHGGFMHLVNNMLGLLVAGMFLRPLLGNLGLIGAYLFAGAVAAIVSAAWPPDTVSVGASGAIMGLFGILVTLVATRDPKVEGIRGVILVVTAIYGGLSLLLGFFSERTDNAAHLGGLLAGIPIGIVVRIWRGESPRDTSS